MSSKTLTYKFRSAGGRGGLNYKTGTGVVFTSWTHNVNIRGIRMPPVQSSLYQSPRIPYRFWPVRIFLRKRYRDQQFWYWTKQSKKNHTPKSGKGYTSRRDLTYTTHCNVTTYLTIVFSFFIIRISKVQKSRDSIDLRVTNVPNDSKLLFY